MELEGSLLGEVLGVSLLLQGEINKKHLLLRPTLGDVCSRGGHLKTLREMDDALRMAG